MGLGLAQLGEFSFVLFSEAMQLGVMSVEDYNRMLFIALGTLIATPELLRLGSRWTSDSKSSFGEEHAHDQSIAITTPSAIIIGGGRLGAHAARTPATRMFGSPRRHQSG